MIGVGFKRYIYIHIRSKDFFMFFQFLFSAEILILYTYRFDLSKLKRFNYFTLTLINFIK